MEIKQTIEIKFSCQNCSPESLDPGNVLVSRLLEKLETTKDFSLGEEAAVQQDISAPHRTQTLLLPKNTELVWNNARFWPTFLSRDKEFTGTLCVFLLQAQRIRRKVYWKITWFWTFYGEFVRRKLCILVLLHALWTVFCLWCDLSCKICVVDVWAVHEIKSKKACHI